MTADRIGRAQVMRRLLAHYEQPRYLEIGVCEGRTFDRVPAAVRVAVDPEFRFDHTAPERQEPGTSYHQITSDDYFGTVVDPDARFDVIYLDGLHTVEQTLRDLLNALPHLQPQGVLVIDDVRPPTELAAIPDRQEFFDVRAAQGRDDEKAWMGTCSGSCTSSRPSASSCRSGSSPTTTARPSCGGTAGPRFRSAGWPRSAR